MHVVLHSTRFKSVSWFGGRMASKRCASTSEGHRKKSKQNCAHDCVRRMLSGGVFWDIENIPVKKATARTRVPEIKRALTHFVTNVNHHAECCPPSKTIDKFVAVARQKLEGKPATTADIVKTHIRQNDIELVDLPFSSNPDYCDDAIFHAVERFTADRAANLMVIALTGDVGLVRRINVLQREFDLIVITKRAGKKTSILERHCANIKATNLHGRQQAVYFMDEVIRKCTNGSVPLTYSQLLRIKRSRGEEDFELDDDHLSLLFPDS